ncbi:SLOG family protein [Streptomyces sp. NPDC050738]|uniref:SLOG family protein n=1 Tax=Streptomyces sp. NPDC050738 TaxID=3154744 RepID=UPI00343E6C9F
MRPYRVLVTGSPKWDDEHLVHRELARSLADAQLAGSALIVTCCRATGAGFIATRWALAMRAIGVLYVLTEPHPSPEGDFAEAPCAAQTVERDAVAECLVFTQQCRRHDCLTTADHLAHGTPQCGALADAAGVPTHRRDDHPVR